MSYFSEIVKQRRQLEGMYIMYACTKKELQKSPKHILEHQNSQEAFPQTPLAQSTLWAPPFVFALGPPNPPRGPVHTRVDAAFSVQIETQSTIQPINQSINQSMHLAIYLIVF